MSEASGDNTSTRAASLRDVRVVNWPLRDEPLYALAVSLGCVAAGVLAGVVASSGAMGLLAASCLLLAFWKLWVPVACELGPSGITISVLRWRRHVAWRQIERVQCVARGVLICGPTTVAWAQSWCSLYLPWRYHPQLVIEFHAQYGGAIREPLKTPDTCPR
jgi:hypothetical protein